MSDKKYLLVINGRPEGPFGFDELRAKGIKPADFVRTDGMDDYKEAHEVSELRELFGFRHQLTGPQYFAGFDQRLLASVIDWFIVSFGFVILAFIIVLFTSNQMVRAAVALSLIILIPLTNLIYHTIMESSPKQGTHGKQILKIRVGDMQGQRITAGKALGRNLAKVFSILSFGVGYLVSFFNKKQQCLHDMFAGTLVVKDRLV